MEPPTRSALGAGVGVAAGASCDKSSAWATVAAARSSSGAGDGVAAGGERGATSAASVTSSLLVSEGDVTGCAGSVVDGFGRIGAFAAPDSGRVATSSCQMTGENHHTSAPTTAAATNE